MFIYVIVLVWFIGEFIIWVFMGVWGCELLFLMCWLVLGNIIGNGDEKNLGRFGKEFVIWVFVCCCGLWNSLVVCICIGGEFWWSFCIVCGKGVRYYLWCCVGCFFGKFLMYNCVCEMIF